MRLSVVIPARNEEGSIAVTVGELATALRRAGIAYEIVIVDDASTDGTADEVGRLGEADADVRYLRSPYRNGFGFAVRAGLETFTGDAVAIVMADGSDDPEDLVAYHRLLSAGYDCAFGSRFIPGASVSGYPRPKLIANRIVNTGIRIMFGHGYNDTTNAFKAYRREVIDNVQPLLSHHFNLTVELPLKAIIRGHSYAITPIRWRGRTAGKSKLQLQEMGSRYLFVVLYAFFEYHLSRGDYQRRGAEPNRGHRWRAGRPGALPRRVPGTGRRSGRDHDATSDSDGDRQRNGQAVTGPGEASSHHGCDEAS
jgi:dolichol-phosphate mannosyltransferase